MVLFRGIVLRGQVSLEYLVLSLVALSLLSVAVFALLNLKDYSVRASGALLFRSSADSLANAISETCALGSGNGRSVVLKAPLSVEYLDSMVRFTGPDASLVRSSRCEVISAGRLEGRVYVENDAGIIFLK